MNDERSEEYAIEAIGLTRRFGKRFAVAGIDLQIPVGAVFGFIGPNGAGKSTTIRMLLGLLRPTSGEARVLGMSTTDRPHRIRQRVGYVPEVHFIYRWMRVGDVLKFCRSLYEHWDDSRSEEMLRLFELDADRKVKHLSKGMQVKLALIIATAHDPEVLILDEPTSGLDPLVREEFLDGVLRNICERRRTVLFSSHTLSDVQRIADVVGIIHEGRLLACGPTDELVSGTKRIRAVLRDGRLPDRAPEGTIWQRIERREWLMTVRGFSPAVIERIAHDNPVDHVEVLDIGLEEVFKDYIRGRKTS